MFFKWVENIVGKGEIARYEQFLLFPAVISKDFYCKHVKNQGLFGKGLKIDKGYFGLRAKKDPGAPCERSLGASRSWGLGYPAHDKPIKASAIKLQWSICCMLSSCFLLTFILCSVFVNKTKQHRKCRRRLSC